MARKPLFLTAIVVLGILVGIGGFWAFTHLGTCSIQEVKARCSDPRVSLETVRLRGEVASAWDIPLTPYSVYRVGDRTDSIWVVSERDAPPEGTPIRIRGRARSMRVLEQRCLDERFGDEEDCRVLGLAAKFIAGSCVVFEDVRE